MNSIPEEFFEQIKKSCLPGIWSKGIALARGNRVQKQKQTESEWILVVSEPQKPVSHLVSLWPDDEDWFCNCKDRNEICPHIAAAVVAIKNNQLKATEKKSQVSYHFFEQKDRLFLERKASGVPLTQRLVSEVGGFHSGRVKRKDLWATQADLSIDAIFEKPTSDVPLSEKVIPFLLKTLSGNPNVYFNSDAIDVSDQQVKLHLIIRDVPGPASNGVRLQLKPELERATVFQNGAILVENTLRPLLIPSFSEIERKALSVSKGLFDKEQYEILLGTILPAFESKLIVKNESSRLPKPRWIQPKIEIRIQKLGEKLYVTPEITYPSASLELKELVIRDQQKEAELSDQIRKELDLAVGQTSVFEKGRISDFDQKLTRSQFNQYANDSFIEAELTPELVNHDGDFQVRFENASKTENFSFQQAIEQWRQNESLISLTSGGWARLPVDWLNRNAEKIEELIETQKALRATKTPKYLAPQWLELLEDQETPKTPALQKLKESLFETSNTPEPPSDLKADLRNYQKAGVRWLKTLQNAEVGALLADDMGLGKTLQAICCIQKKTLIVSPTSVLPNWKEQIIRFRPNLSVHLYYGPERKLSSESDVVLTSYGVFRADIDQLKNEDWSCVFLDESQTIKNPDSLLARAAHQIQAKFKIALSGTPIENRPEDLWSQFEFLNPGLLGTRSGFKEEFSRPIVQGNSEKSSLLKKRIEPFFLRRLKKDVLQELPPKTETVLYCELSETERDLYQSILATTKKEALEKLNEGESIFSILEVLLRLRQACCHPNLVRDTQRADTSAKLDVLSEVLTESVDLGHRCLVFSQWTRMLDLIEPQLKKLGITFLRLDGSTRNRDQIIQNFQSPNGPSVLLISLKAGGVGLNLTAADHLFLMDPWWNPTVETQATDRAHRIGQTQAVLVHRLIAQNSIEEKVLELQKTKVQVADSVLEGIGNQSLSKEDIAQLLREL